LRPCPDNRCDGSGFVFDEQTRKARPCSCRPARMARKRAAILAARIPNRYRGVSFDREPVPSIEASAPSVVREVRQYIRDISAHLRDGLGIWFAGDVGTGKTTLAMLISKAALEHNHTVAIYSLPRLLSLLRATYNESSAYSLLEILDRLCAVDLLHIDDVGAEQTSPWVLEQLYNVVNTRYEDGRALLLTTNLIAAVDPPVKDPSTGQPLKEPGSDEVVTEPRDAPLRRQIGDRTVSRIYEICGMPKFLYGDDRRPLPDVRIPGATPLPRHASVGAADATDRARDEDTIWEGATPSRYGRRP
jgi:DNA replication protein DnaC